MKDVIIILICIIPILAFIATLIHLLEPKSAKPIKSPLITWSSSEDRKLLIKPDVINKFNKALIDLCSKEGIYVEIYKDLKHLNDIVETKSINDADVVYIRADGKQIKYDNLAAGQYVYFRSGFDTPEKRIARQMPKIKLQKNYRIWTLAHELGHHFTIQYQNIETEEAANAYIKTLAEQLLTKEEQKILDIEINVWSS